MGSVFKYSVPVSKHWYSAGTLCWRRLRANLDLLAYDSKCMIIIIANSWILTSYSEGSRQDKRGGACSDTKGAEDEEEDEEEEDEEEEDKDEDEDEDADKGNEAMSPCYSRKQGQVNSHQRAHLS